jgi:hypothetical protein
MTYLLLILKGSGIFLLKKNGGSVYGLFLANLGVLLMPWEGLRLGGRGTAVDSHRDTGSD